PPGEGPLDHPRQQPDGVRRRLQRLRPEGDDRGRRGGHAARAALPGLVLLGVPGTSDSEPRTRRGRLVSTAARPRVVIVGGGFGGLFAAKFLRRAAVDITL